MATYRSTYTGNFRGIGKMLQRPGMALAVRKAAHNMQPIAESISPIGHPPDDPHPGEYARSFRVVYGVKPVKFRGRPSERPYARLMNTAPYAWRLEHGDGRIPRYAVLRKTIEIAKAAHHGT